VVVAALPGSDTALALEQIELALLLLLAVLGGTAAAVVVADAVARALGNPIDTLRRTALAIGRRETVPDVTDVPAEFEPVFNAIRQMEHDLRESTAELEAGRLRTAAILSTVATGVIGVDATGAVMHANPRAREILGRAITVGMPATGQLPHSWDTIGEGIVRLLGSTTRTPESREVEVGERRFDVTLAPLGDGGLVLAITDITEASRAARVLAWGEMARQVAHEIKNPLTPMRLGLQHLRRVRADNNPGFPALVEETTQRLLNEIDRLDRIARSFARYGTPPAGEAAPLESIDLRAVGDEIAGLYQLSAERPTIEVVGEGPRIVSARREELAQVLLNLLDNARQAGASRVRLLIGDSLLIVEDDGQGVPADQLGRIFEPSFSTNTSGTGLGLAIVRRLVEGWGGSIEVASTPSVGATFTIRFPVGG
jgi:nitrogen fixation/metabolism regulation signal transduction histidine kinase